MKISNLVQLKKYIEENNPEELFVFALKVSDNVYRYTLNHLYFDRSECLQRVHPKFENNKLSLHKIKDNGTILKSTIPYESNNVPLKIFTEYDEAVFNANKIFEEQYRIFLDRKNHIDSEFKNFKNSF